MIFVKTLRKYRKKILFFLCVFVLASLLLGFSPALSANYLGQKQVSIGANQVINDDLYLTGETLTIDGIVKGDAVLFSKQITINGTIDRKLFLVFWVGDG